VTSNARGLTVLSFFNLQCGPKDMSQNIFFQENEKKFYFVGIVGCIQLSYFYKLVNKFFWKSAFWKIADKKILLKQKKNNVCVCVCVCVCVITKVFFIILKDTFRRHSMLYQFHIQRHTHRAI